MKLAGFIIGIIIGILLALSVKTVYANYEYYRLAVVESIPVTGGGYKLWVVWDEAEKTNCYVSNYGGVSCIRSMNY